MNSRLLIFGNRARSTVTSGVLKGALGLLIIALPCLSFTADAKANLPKAIDLAVKDADRTLIIIEGNVRTNQFEAVQQGLKEYKELLDAAIPKATEYFVGRVKTPGILKDAEIRLRKQIRRLADIRPELPIPLRTDLDSATDSAETLRKQLFRELLGPSKKKPNSLA
ncbi:MAG: hypothetical protein PHX83_10515 [Acidobacteriia bacterium]|nr:hypothetical protein [Terriglobia bacterium]